MKRQRSLRPNVESLEKIALLSTSVVPHAAFHAAVPAVVRGTPSTGVHLVGGIGSGRGYVSPLGSVKGAYNLVQRTLTLTNSRGLLELQLSQLHKYPNVVQFGAWQIIKGTGQYATWQGAGSGSFTLVIVGGRAVASSAAFY
jgi:hypothetical protein